MSWTERYCSVSGGGAHDGTTAADAWTFAEAIAGVAAGQRVNQIAGTYANTTTNRTLSTNGTTTAPIWWRGYKTSIGDQDSNNNPVLGTDVPLITYTTGQMTVSGTHQILSSMGISSACTTSGGALVCTSAATGIALFRVSITNTAANTQARALTLSGVQECIASALSATTTADRCVSIGNQALLFGCTVTGGIIGLLGNSSSVSSLFCVYDSQAGDAIQLTGVGGIITGNSVYNPTGNGINITSVITTIPLLIANNYFENVNQASKAAINNTSGTNTNLVRCVGNAYYNCTSNLSGLTESFAIFDNGTLASAGFIAPGSQNFGLLGVAQNLGYPGLFEGTNTYQGFHDVGAVQGAHANRSRSFSGF